MNRLLPAIFSSSICAFIAAALILLPVQAKAIDPGNLKAEKRAVRQNLQQNLANINLLQQAIDQQQEKINTGEHKERDLLGELEILDRNIQQQQSKIAILEKQLSQQQNLIHKKEGEIGRINIKKKTVLEHLQKRLKTYYTRDKIGVANIAFSTETFPELLSFHDAFSQLLTYDEAIINTYRATIGELQDSLTLLDREKGVLASFISEAHTEQEGLDRALNDQLQLLNQIRTQKKLHEQAVTEMDKAARSLTASLNTLEKKSRLLEQGFLLNKGQLAPPVTGPVLVDFGEEKENRLGIRSTSTGISIQARNGIAVKSIFEGTVIFAAYLRGYGNTVIIDHGHSYSSLVSRIEKILVKKGQRVSTGQTIARTGPTATLMEDGVLVEIRKGQTPLAPLAWLDHKHLPKP